jgi:type VI protein secretion system component Hcp
VSAALARAPETAVPADAKATGPSATLSGIGTIALLSVNLDSKGVPREGESPREIVLTSKIGKHSALLSKASADGTSMDVEILMPSNGLRIKLTGAVVSSYSASGGSETWKLDFSSIKFEHEAGEPEEGDRPRRGEWDDLRGL